MRLVWKLLRRHISPAQLAGFFFANLLGMLIVLLALQFYKDVKPIFSEEDGFIRPDYLILSKRISTLNTIGLGSVNTFTERDMKDLESQPFAKRVGAFTASQYKVSCSMGIDGVAQIGTEMFFESVPDAFVDVDLRKWHFSEGDDYVPIILPKTYLAIYNFGFAQNRSLPKVSEGLVSLIDFDLHLRGNGQEAQYKGRVIGFSGRLNAILVPQSFMTMANRRFAPSAEAEDDRLNTEKTTFFLRLMITVVMAIGLVISLLSFYILMLSIYLLVQKNADKLQNLLLIGYRPSEVARPYQLLTIGLNVVVLLLALVVVALVRSHYMRIVEVLFSTTGKETLLPAILLGLLLLVVVTLLNMAVIRRKIIRIWHGKERI